MSYGPIIGYVKSHLNDDSHKGIIQTAYKVLNSWIEETPKENIAGSECEMKHD